MVNWGIRTVFDSGRWCRWLTANGTGLWGIVDRIAKEYGVARDRVREIIGEIEEEIGVKIVGDNVCKSKEELKDVARKLTRAVEIMEERFEKEALRDWVYDRMVYDRELKKFVKA